MIKGIVGILILGVVTFRIILALLHMSTHDEWYDRWFGNKGE